MHHNLGGAQLWVSAALGEGGSQGATDHPGARSPGLRGERPGPLEGAGEAVRLCGHRGLTPRLTSGGGLPCRSLGCPGRAEAGVKMGLGGGLETRTPDPCQAADLC